MRPCYACVVAAALLRVSSCWYEVPPTSRCPSLVRAAMSTPSDDPAEMEVSTDPTAFEMLERDFQEVCACCGWWSDAVRVPVARGHRPGPVGWRRRPSRQSLPAPTPLHTGGCLCSHTGRPRALRQGLFQHVLVTARARGVRVVCMEFENAVTDSLWCVLVWIAGFPPPPRPPTPDCACVHPAIESSRCSGL
jgi:hypothetical protein